MKGDKEITNSEDVIDSRDVIERIEYLEADEEELDEYDKDELAKLRALAEEGEDYAADWKYGEQLIRATYFEEYARQLAEDIGAVNSEADWPNNCIDWEQAASELEMDYTSIDFDGVDYWIR